MGRSSPTMHIPNSELLQLSSKNCDRVFDVCSATARVTQMLRLGMEQRTGKESENHRMARVRRALKDHPVPSPLP